MKYIQAFLFLFLILVVACFALIQSDTSAPRFISYSACGQPLTYRIEHIDNRYKIDETSVIKVMKKVNKAWSDAVGKKLLEYSKTGELGIHLIYSDEQQEFDSERQLMQRIENEKRQYQELKVKYEELTSQYGKELGDYKKNLADYNQKLHAYNTQVANWNSKGGVPKDKKQDLGDAKKQLDQLKTDLDRQRRAINQLGEKVHRYSNRLNSQAEQQNALVFHYNQRFNKQKEFDQGNYVKAGKQKNIYVYQFDDVKNLTMVLAHEVGHALGLNHVQNPTSIMYYLMDQQNEDKLQLTKEDIRAIKQQCAG